MAINTVARVRTVFTGVAGAPAYSNLYFDDDGTAAGNYQTAVADFWNTYEQWLASGVVWTMVNPIPIISTTTGEVVDVANGDGGTGTGTASGDMLSPATQGLAQLHTGVYVAGREIRGRIFLPYVTELANTAGKPDPSYISTNEDALDDLNGGSGANGAMCIYSRKNGRAELLSFTAVWNQWAVLRSRRD